MERIIAGTGLPTFSIVMEAFTVTAETVESQGKCLSSLETQNLSPSRANEVLLMSGGQINQEELRLHCQPYPWLDILEMAPGTR